MQLISISTGKALPLFGIHHPDYKSVASAIHKKSISHLQNPVSVEIHHLGIKGDEVFDISGITELNNGVIPKTVQVKAGEKSFTAKVRIDTPGEADYYRHGGIMQYVLRSRIWLLI